MSIDKKKFRIRKLTPTECYRLMGHSDEDIQKVKDIGMSDSQMYKQAGNGIVTNCVELIFEHLYQAQYNNDFKCYDEKFSVDPTDHGESSALSGGGATPIAVYKRAILTSANGARCTKAAEDIIVHTELHQHSIPVVVEISRVR